MSPRPAGDISETPAEASLAPGLSSAPRALGLHDSCWGDCSGIVGGLADASAHLLHVRSRSIHSPGGKCPGGQHLPGRNTPPCPSAPDIVLPVWPCEWWPRPPSARSLPPALTAECRCPPRPAPLSPLPIGNRDGEVEAKPEASGGVVGVKAAGGGTVTGGRGHLCETAPCSAPGGREQGFPGLG